MHPFWLPLGLCDPSGRRSLQGTVVNYSLMPFLALCTVCMFAVEGSEEFELLLKCKYRLNEYLCFYGKRNRKFGFLLNT